MRFLKILYSLIIKNRIKCIILFIVAFIFLLIFFNRIIAQEGFQHQDGWFFGDEQEVTKLERGIGEYKEVKTPEESNAARSLGNRNYLENVPENIYSQENYSAETVGGNVHLSNDHRSLNRFRDYYREIPESYKNEFFDGNYTLNSSEVNISSLIIPMYKGYMC